ncbi:MAG: nucleotide exchange factor GrpE [Candidatus Promineifilaceae bacterium]
MFPPNYDRYGRRGGGAGRNEPTQVLTASQIARIEAAFEELQQKAAHWESQANQWRTTAAESKTTADEWKERASDLERALADARRQAEAAQQNCDHWQSLAAGAQEKFDAWESKAGSLESDAALAEQRVKELEEALAAAQAGHDEEADRLEQIEADFLESKQRLERRFAIQAEQERKNVYRELLPVLDNLDLALSHLSGDSEDARNLRQGVELTRQSFLKMLAQNGVRLLDPLGEPFDPQLHEAVGTVPDPRLPAGTVVRVERPGYTIGDELVRPARVLVTPL